MTKVKIDKFCSLAHSPSWQAWLYHFDANLFSEFTKKIRASRGCSQNTDIMIDTLKDIDKDISGSDKLLKFLRLNYPYMLVDDVDDVKDDIINDEIFEHYNPDILTYPHRLIIAGSKQDLLNRIQTFSENKLRVDYVIVDDKLYIEYLNNNDGNISSKIPKSNWKIASWKLKHDL